MLKLLRCFLILVLFWGNAGPAYSQTAPFFPRPAAIGFSVASEPVMLKGIRLYPEDPLKFDFIFDYGDQPLDEGTLKKETEKLIGYFLTSLTIAEKDIEMNMDSRGVAMKDSLQSTLMGRDLLAQDYVLKLLSASLTDPRTDTGRAYWNMVYSQLAPAFHTTDVPVDVFNRVWFMPGKAQVFKKDNVVLISESRIRIASERHVTQDSENSDEKFAQESGLSLEQARRVRDISSTAVDQVLVPALEKEVNAGKNFATVRQIYQCFVLATWYKQNAPSGPITQYYADREKLGPLGQIPGGEISLADIFKNYILSLSPGTVGKTSFDRLGLDSAALFGHLLTKGYIDSDGVVQEKFRELKDFSGLSLDPVYGAQKEQIYHLLRYAPQGVYDLVQEELDPVTGETIPRKYFSGGVDFRDLSSRILKTREGDAAGLAEETRQAFRERKYFQAVTVLTAVPLGAPIPEAGVPAPSIELLQNNAFSGMAPSVINIQTINVPAMIGL